MKHTEVNMDLMRKSSSNLPKMTHKKFPIAESSKIYNTQSHIKPEEINLEAAYIQQGYATYLRQALPQASFIGFTGTPISQKDRNTIETFGNYIDIYDIQRAVEDEATVKIYYETRLAKLDLEPSERPKIDPNFEEITEEEELTTKEKLKSKWARLEALIGAEKRINQIAKDIVEHFENRTAAPELRDGKAMIVCMSRRICADLYHTIIQLKPEWHSEDDNQGMLKVIMTGSATDDLKMKPHIRSKKARKELAKRFKKPDDAFKLVIVRDMWLTGFDAPSLHTLYVDKPMQGHNLMQAIARVNRVFKDKPGRLIVDYLGIAEQLKEVRGLPYRNLALETLQKLINEAIKISSRKNLILARSFREMLENTIKRYQNRAIETAQVINELIELAKAMREAQKRGEDLGLTEDETAFYDALEVNDSAVINLGDDILKTIARDLVKAIRANITIDWTVKENVRAKLRVTIKRLLKKYGYPPDKCDKATSTVLEQAELLCKDWVA